MGIKYLNRYLLNKCRKSSIHRISLQYLTGKTIVIDTFIYIYKYLGEDRLIENMHQLVTTLVRYNVTPIFIFDGKPPQEKKELLLQRREKKKEAENKYREIIEQIESGLEDHTNNLDSQLACLKKQFLKVDYGHIQMVKSILREYNIEMIDAPGESDELCVQYVKSNRAWACLSDDMDMFVYGATRVLRELSLTNQSVELYNLPAILGDLNMSMKTFRQIMVLSGTDYNIHDNVSLNESLKWYYEYKKYGQRQVSTRCMDFYDWLRKYTKYIQDYDRLMVVYHIFDV